MVEERDYDRAGRLDHDRRHQGRHRAVGVRPDPRQGRQPDPRSPRPRASRASRPVTEATAYTYDAADRLTAECFGAQTCAGASAERTDYTYDLVGNRKTKKVVAPGENTTTTYTYDAADQLTDEQITGTRSEPAHLRVRPGGQPDPGRQRHGTRTRSTTP